MAEPLTAEDLALLRSRAYWGSNAGDMLRLLVEVDRQNARIAALTEQRAAKLAEAEAAYTQWRRQLTVISDRIRLDRAAFKAGVCWALGVVEP